MGSSDGLKVDLVQDGGVGKLAAGERKDNRGGESQFRREEDGRSARKSSRDNRPIFQVRSMERR